MKLFLNQLEDDLPNTTPERRLLCAILRRAVMDLIEGEPRHQRDAAEWVLHRKECPITYKDVEDYLDLGYIVTSQIHYLVKQVIHPKLPEA